MEEMTTDEKDAEDEKETDALWEKYNKYNKTVEENIKTDLLSAEWVWFYIQENSLLPTEQVREEDREALTKGFWTEVGRKIAKKYV